MEVHNLVSRDALEVYIGWALRSLQSRPEVTLGTLTPTKSHFPGISVMCYYGGIECIYAFFSIKNVYASGLWLAVVRAGAAVQKHCSAAYNSIGDGRSVHTVSTEAAIMGNLAKVSQLEQQAVLKKVGQFPRFTAMMLECQHDEQGKRIQKECDIAKKVSEIALKRLVAKAAKTHCQQTTDELEKLPLVARGKQCVRQISDR